MSIKQ